MAARRMVLAVAAVLVLGGCGSDDDAPAAETPIVVASATPTAEAGKAGKAGKATSGKKVAATVAPEVVVPTAADATSPRTNFDGWRGRLVTELSKLDSRLVTSDEAAMKKVRATCKQMETGMFESKVVPIIQKRFSNSEVTLSYDVAQEIYSLLLQDACYIMNES
ncbi:MAG TPA: hypothetical protein VMZ00_00080 [Sporichthya sp.]|nr:hypothetical protein [Sporichthya sp.]